MGFAKLDSSIVDSSIMDAPRDTLLVFLLMLAIADRHGVVDVTVPALARRFNMTGEDVAEAIRQLESPDSMSRSPEHEGRRLLRLDDHRPWGWRIANYERFRNARDAEARREYKAQNERERRAKARQERQEGRERREVPEHVEDKEAPGNGASGPKEAKPADVVEVREPVKAGGDARSVDVLGLEIASEGDKSAREREKRARIAFLAERLPDVAVKATEAGCADLWAWRMAGVSGAKKPNAWRQLGQLRKLCGWVVDDKVGPEKVGKLLQGAAKGGWGGFELKYLDGWGSNGSGSRKRSSPTGASPNLTKGRYDHLPKGLYHGDQEP